MKITNKLYMLVFAISLLSFTSCELEGGESLNGASTSSITDDLSRGELPQAVSGVLSDMRSRLNTQIDVQSIFGREYYYFTSSDPRFTADVVTGVLDNSAFYAVSPWRSRYSTVKDINLALEGLENTTADFSTQEISSIRGVLNTLKAHELLSVSNNQYTNGIRLDVADPDNLGAFVTYEEALTGINDLLVTAASDLGSGGANFPFSLTSGYTGFDTPAGFLKFNKGINARVEAYRGNYSNVRTLLGTSFMNLSGDMNTGVYHTFSLSGADQANPLFSALNQTANRRVAHASFINDALVDDTRVNKVVLRDKPDSEGGLIGTHDVWIYRSNEDAIPMIRNEELILLFAEANMMSNPNEAKSAIDAVRAAAGLGAYTGDLTPAALEDEILFQRRYSLFGEGHRWIDMRRFSRISELPNDRAGDNVPNAVPVPRNENQ